MRDEAANCFILGLVASGGPTPLWLTGEADGEVVGVAAQTRPVALAVTGLPADAVAPLTDYLVSVNWTGLGVVGPVGAVDQLAEAWAARSGKRKRLLASLRLFQLTAVVAPRVA